MTEQMRYATYGRSRHRRRPVGHLRPRRREEREKANGRNIKALDPPNEHEDEATTNAHRTSTITAATDSSAMANADGPEGCYYIPKRVHNCGMDMELVESSSARDAREASSKSPVSSRPSAARAVARGADPPTRRSSSNNTSKSPARRRPSKWDASTPSLVSSNKTLPAQAPLTHSPGSRPSTPARSRSRRSASPATPPTPPRSPRSPSPERSRVNVNLTRSRSWDGRTKHYDRNRMKSFNSDTQDGGYTSSGGGSAAAASRLSKQLSGFDLSNNSSRRRRASANSEGRGDMVGTSSSSSSRNKAAKSSSKSVGKQSSFKMTKHEAKSFLKDKVIPLMPVMGSTSCKKRCSRKQLERSDASLNNHNGKKNTTTTRGVGEDGSATYNSSNYDSDSYNSNDDEGCSDDESESGSDRSYYSSNEESDADSEVEASSYYSSDEERKEPEGRRRSSRSSFLSDPRDYHDKNSSFHDSEPGSDYGESGSEGCYSSDDSRDSDEDEEGNYQSSDDEGNETDSYASGSTHSHRRGRMSRRRNTESHGSSHRSRSRSSKSKKDEEFSESDFHSMSRRSTKSHRGSHRSRSMNSDSRRDEEVSDADSQTSRSSRRKSLRSSDSKTSTSRTREKARTNAKDDSDDTNSQSSNKTYAPSKAIANKKEFNESQKQLVGLIKENETLRSNVIKLRSDFETMLHHMNALEDSASTVVDGDSISSDDNSRVSHCLRRIEDAKTLALEKIEEEEQRRRMMGKKGSARKEMNLGCDEADVRMIKEFVMEGKYKDLQSYQQCIDDLLSENERLYSKVVALSKEREEITKEVHALRNSCSDNTNHKVFTLPAAISSPDEAGTGQDLLTDKEVAKSHTQTMDNIASLIRGISILSKDKEALSKKEEVDVKDKKEEKEQKQKKERDAAVDAMGNEIMQLVSKILTQRVPVAAAAAQEDKALNDGEDVNDKEVKSDCEDDKTSPFDSGDGDKQRISNRRRSEQSNHHNESFSSICTVTSSESNDDENRYIYKEGNVSSNSLFDGTSPSTVDSEGRGDNDDDDTSTLEIIYEYETDSEDRSESAPSYTSQRSAYSDSGDDERYDDNGSYGDETYSTYKQEGKESYYPDEDVEYPPRGYHRYSPSTSRHSSRSSSTTKNRTSSGSEESGDRPSRRGKSFHSHCSSSKSERGNGIPVAIEDDKSPKKLAQDKSNDTPLPASKESQTDENKSQMDEHSRDLDKLEAEQEELVQAIESHLTGLPLLMRSSSFEASVSADTSSVGDMTYPSHNSCATGGTGSSTRECKCITITVVSRASRHVSFPSSPEHTYMTFFNATLMKSQVDAVLEEQFQETREILQSSVVTQARSNCSTSGSSRGSKKKKYQGEYNENGHRHGYGIYTSKNGNEYRGEWQHNKREGLGVVKIGNGDVFEGQFECNLKNGIGVYHYKDGECDLSLYKDDARIGDSIRYSKDRTQAFLLSDKSAGVSKSISFEVAAEIAKGMGTIVQC